MLDDAPHYDVFISYAREDDKRLGHASKLDADLTAQGFRVWRDTRGIDPARDFTAEIERAIEASDFVVACITPDVRRDESFVRREIQYALVVKKPVLVARFEKDLPPPIHIINNTWVDFHAGWDGALLQLAGYLRSRPDAIRHTPPSPHTADPFRPYVEWLYKRLVTLLDQAVIRLIDLSAQDSPDAVEHPRPRRDMFDQRFLPFTLESASPAAGEPEVFTRFEQAFEHYQGRLLLLGEPGAGKSVTLMAHAREAAARRLDNPSASLPLFGIIATWDARNQTPLADWLADSYDDLDAAALQREIDAGRALLLLDGLDELGREIREEPEPGEMGRDVLQYTPTDASQADAETRDPRRRFLGIIPANNRIVVSCRITDYAEIGQKAALNGAVTLQPLSETQLRVYLEKQPDLLAAIEADPDLKQMLTTPLILSLFAFAYQDMTPEDAAQLRDLAHSPGDLRDAIIGRYVRERYAWEDKKHGPLAFTLEEVYEVLGDAALANSVSWIATENVLEIHHFPESYTAEHLAKFTSLGSKLNLLAARESNTWRFVHLVLRDYFAVSYALRHLHDQDKSIRINAVEILGKIGDARAYEPLIETFYEEDQGVRAYVVLALGELRDKRAFELLVEALYDKDQNIRASAIHALGELGDERAIKPLVEIYHDQDGRLQSNAANALRFLGVLDYPEIADDFSEPFNVHAVDSLITFLIHPEPKFRAAAAGSLGYLGDIRAVESLIQALSDIESKVRSAAAESLGKLGDPQAIQPLIIALNDTESIVCCAAAEALGRLGDTRVVDFLIITLNNAVWWRRAAAAVALGELGDTRAVVPLIAILKDENRWVRAYAIEALGRLKDAHSVIPLNAALRDEDRWVRVSTAYALGYINDVRSVTPLTLALHDIDRDVRRRAANALEHIGTPEALAAVEAYRRGEIKPDDS